MPSFARYLAISALSFALAAAGGLVADAVAKSPAGVATRAVRSFDGKRVAEVRPRATGGDGLFVDGRLAWPPAGASGRRATVSTVRWARPGHAVALLAREGAAAKLVVVLVAGEARGQVLEWPVPREAMPARAIMWLDAQRVAVGPRELEPKLVASWNVKP